MAFGPRRVGALALIVHDQNPSNRGLLHECNGVHNGERVLEAMPTIKTNVERLIWRVIARTEPLRSEAPGDLGERVWLYRSRSNRTAGQVLVLSDWVLQATIRGLVDEYGLAECDGQPLRINISRLGKTFGNRIFELLHEDLENTAIALGNRPQVVDRNYLAPGEDAKRNWRFMGEVLVGELLNGTIGATYKVTPVGRCGDPIYGQYAPKKEGATCTNFINCLRCRHYAVTGDDLYKQFSFYFRVFAERTRIDKRRWAREYAYVPRLIDNYIVVEGLRRRYFELEVVEVARKRARLDPHPFWSFDTVTGLEVFA